MGDKGWIEVQAELQAYLALALVILWEDICSRKFLISAKETNLQSNTTGNVTGRTGIARSRVQIPLMSWIFSGFLRNCINCVHNCEDHSSIDHR